MVHANGRVDIDGEELRLTVWNHDPDRLLSAVDYWGRAVWKPRYRVLSVPRLFGYVFNMRRWTSGLNADLGRRSRRNSRRFNGQV